VSNGKGDTRRPSNVTKADLDAAWDRTFGLSRNATPCELSKNATVYESDSLSPQAPDDEAPDAHPAR
jgi:hypothetical protein